MSQIQQPAYNRGRAVEGTRTDRGFIQSSIPNERNAFRANLITDIEVGDRVAEALERDDIARGRK